MKATNNYLEMSTHVAFDLWPTQQETCLIQSSALPHLVSNCQALRDLDERIWNAGREYLCERMLSYNVNT